MLHQMINWFETRYSAIKLAENTEPPAGLWRFIYYFISQFRAAFIIRIVLVALGAIVDALVPIYVGLIVGMLTTTPPGEFFTQNGQTLLFMVMTIAVARPILFLSDMLVRNHAIVPNLIDIVRWQSHWHVVRQSWSYFQNDFAGRIANKIMQVGDSIEMSVNSTIDAAWHTLVFAVVAIVVLGGMDWTLMIPVAGWLVLFGILFAVSMPLIARYSEALSEARSAMTGRIVDSYTNIQTLKTFSSGDAEDEYVAESVMAHVVQYRKLMRIFTTMWTILFILNAALVISTAWLALDGWNKGILTTAAVATAIPFVLQIMSMSGWILEIGAHIFRQLGTVRDSMHTVAQPMDMADSPEAKLLKVTEGRIEFDHVSFNYLRSDRDIVIEDLSLTIEPGQKVGLVGRSGAGKSTLVNLLLRLFDLESGSIRIDGQDVREVAQESLRAAIGLVSQDTSLLHRSVRDNIKFGRRDASDEQMIRAAEQARIHDVILGFEDPQGRTGYDAHVGERGVKLSGGQRQRVAIARVLLKDAPILVLDEATSALDSEVEAAIQGQFEMLMQNKTVIAIAHRLSTIAAMDRLIVLDEGKIVEQGTHEELIKKKGHYASLWQRQSGGFLDLDKEPDATE